VPLYVARFGEGLLMKRFLFALAIALAVIGIGASRAQQSSQTVTGVGSNITSSFHFPPWYTFEPKDDVTALELAQAIKAILPAFACGNAYDGCDVSAAIEGLPPNVKRHFVRHER
jgi:hypothetical protein